jgi:hypothetical protein
MVDIDLKALQQECEEGREKNLRKASVGRWYEDQAKADENARNNEKNPRESANPTVIGKSSDIGIVGFEVEDEPETQRPESGGAIEQHRQ